MFVTRFNTVTSSVCFYVENDRPLPENKYVESIFGPPVIKKDGSLNLNIVVVNAIIPPVVFK